MRAFGLFSLPLAAAGTSGPPLWWPTLTVEIGFGDLVSPLSGVTWTDVTEYVSSLGTRRGRDDELQQFQTGTASVTLDNRDGRFDPANTSSPYAPYVAPMRPIRIKANVPAGGSYAAATYVLFTGYIEAWNPTWPSTWAETVQIDCVDGFGVYSVVATSASYSASSAYDRVLDLVGSGSLGGQTERAYSGWTVQIAAKTYDREAMLSAIQDCAVAEAGQFFMGVDGDLVLENRYWRSSIATTSTLTDNPAADDELEYEAVALAYGVNYLYNDVEITDEGSNVGTATNTASSDLYLPRAYSGNVVLNSATATQTLAEFIANRYAEPRLRATSVELRPAPMASSESTPWHAALSCADISKRVSLVGDRPGGAFSQDSFVEGVQHDIDASGEWRISLALSPASVSVGLYDTATSLYDISRFA